MILNLSDLIGIRVECRFNEAIKNTPCNIEVSKNIFKYIDKLEHEDKIKAEDAIRFFKV